MTNQFSTEQNWVVEPRVGVAVRQMVPGVEWALEWAQLGSHALPKYQSHRSLEPVYLGCPCCQLAVNFPSSLRFGPAEGKLNVYREV